MAKVLTLVETGFGYVSYLDGDLVYEDRDRRSYPVEFLRLLGFTVEFFNLSSDYRWVFCDNSPPRSLSELKPLYAKFLMDKRRKRLKDLRDEIGFLEQELKSMQID